MTKDKDKDDKNAKSKGKERWMTKDRVLSDMLTLGHKSGRGVSKRPNLYSLVTLLLERQARGCGLE